MCSTCGCGDPSPVRLTGPTRVIRLEHDLLAHNDAVAAGVRGALRTEGTLALNLVSSPGAGKTTLLVRTLQALRERHPGMPVAVIEGDQATSLDADRIRATGVPAVQVNTGAGCHLDATQVARAREELGPLPGGILFVENVGNLVCPAAFDLGEGRRVVLASVTEGEDKPLKYPHLFATADLVLVTKLDLLPHLDLDLASLVANADRIRPGVRVIAASARTGEGFEEWLGWLGEQRDGVSRR